MKYLITSMGFDTMAGITSCDISLIEQSSPMSWELRLEYSSENKDMETFLNTILKKVKACVPINDDEFKLLKESAAKVSARGNGTYRSYDPQPYIVGLNDSKMFIKKDETFRMKVVKPRREPEKPEKVTTRVIDL